MVLSAVTAASFLVGLRWTRTDPPWAFFSLPSRAWELGVGALLALSVPVLGRLPQVVAAISGWTGLAAVVWSVTRFSGATPFPGTAALLPVLGTAMILIAGTGVGRGGASRLLDRPIVRHLGDVSYSWYLWHWPLLILLPAASGHPLTLPERLATVLAALAAAEVTLRWVENPVRFARPLRPPRRALAFGAVLLVVASGACTAAGDQLGAPTGHGPAAAAITLAPATSPHPIATSPPASRKSSPASPWHLENARLAPILKQATRPRPLPSNLTPALVDAAGDKAPPFVDGCNLTWTATSQPECAYTTGSPAVVIFGDSHAAQWFPPLDAIATARHLRLESFTKTTCPPFHIPIFSPYLDRTYTECETWQAATLARIVAQRPGLVVLGVARHYSSAYGFTVYSHRWLTGLAATVATLHAAGIPVLVMGPTPLPPGDVPTCLSAHLSNLVACDFPRTLGVNATGLDLERRTVLAAGGSYLDPTPWICTPISCAVVVANMLIYRDDNHLTTTYTSWLRPALQPVITAAIAGHQISA